MESWTGVRHLDLFCWGIFPLSVLVLDGDQLRDTSQGLTPVGSGSDAGFDPSIRQCWPWKQHRRCRIAAGSLHADGAENLADLPVALFPMTCTSGIIFNVDGVINMDQDGNPQGVSVTVEMQHDRSR